MVLLEGDSVVNIELADADHAAEQQQQHHSDVGDCEAGGDRDDDDDDDDQRGVASSYCCRHAAGGGCCCCSRRRNHPDNNNRYRSLSRMTTTPSSANVRRRNSLLVLRFAVVGCAINTELLQPNYPLMVSPGAATDSFEDTSPFDFNSATYFIPFTGLLGVAIACMATGALSDKYGRTKVLLLSSVGAAAGSILKWVLRDTFWGFCAANFVTGLLSGHLPVAMSYCGDVFSTTAEKQSQVGMIVGAYMVGFSGGGIIAILMEASGLFAPVLVGSGIMFLSAMLQWKYLVEPGEGCLVSITRPKFLNEEEENVPTEIHQPTLWNIVVGSIADNVGSNALFPLCLSVRLANKTFMFDPCLLVLSINHFLATCL